jgi:hypothetical protein
VIVARNGSLPRADRTVGPVPRTHHWTPHKEGPTRSKEVQRATNRSDPSPTPTVGPKGESDAATRHAVCASPNTALEEQCAQPVRHLFQLGPMLRVRCLSKTTLRGSKAIEMSPHPGHRTQAGPMLQEARSNAPDFTLFKREHSTLA